MYGFLADATMVVHFGFLVFLVVGGFLAWHWPRVIYAHLVMAAWGVVITVFALDCPLTGPEDYFRRKAGEDGLGPEGFIDTYLTGVIYPREDVALVQGVVGGVVLLSWVGFAVLQTRRARARRAERTRS